VFKGRSPDFVSQLLNGEVSVFLHQQDDGRCAVIEISMWKDLKEADEYVALVEGGNMIPSFSATEH